MFLIIDLLWSNIVNSKFYFNIYYKHTKKHKTELKVIKEKVLAIRKKAIGN